MFNEIYDKKGLFHKVYIDNLTNRFTNASLGVEGVEGNLADTIQAINIYNQTMAIEYALKLPRDEKLTVQNIKNIIDCLTGGEVTNFRTTQAEIYGSNVPRSKAKNIYMDLYTLFDNYYNVWSDLDPYLREAYFHIKFLHIHPFEDGNGRTARILLFRNLCATSQLPCIITKEVKSEYCSYIENSDYEGLANFFKRISDKELITMLNIYKNLNDKGLIKENNMNERQKREYNRILGYQSLEENQKIYPLRKIETIKKIFKYGVLDNNANNQLSTNKLVNMKEIFDLNSGDKAFYYENSKSMIIKIINDERVFSVQQVVNDLKYEIDGEQKYDQEFEAELNYQTMKRKKNKTKTKKL